VVCLVVVEQSCTGEVSFFVTVAQNKDTGWELADVLEKKGSWQD
jgi:hypothetical protein